jgi:competence protein ComEC
LGKNYFNSVFYIPKNEEELDFKHYYKAEAYITQPNQPQYDFQFDYAEYLKRKNINYQIYISEKISLQKEMILIYRSDQAIQA